MPGGVNKGLVIYFCIEHHHAYTHVFISDSLFDNNSMLVNVSVYLLAECGAVLHKSLQTVFFPPMDFRKHYILKKKCPSI